MYIYIYDMKVFETDNIDNILSNDNIIITYIYNIICIYVIPSSLGTVSLIMMKQNIVFCIFILKSFFIFSEYLTDFY